MTILTPTDLLERFGERELAERTDREHYATVDLAVVERAIADAEADINAYLAPVGLVGIDPPKALVIKGCDIARYYLYDDGAPEIVIERYKTAIAWLKDVMRHPQMLKSDASSSNSAQEIVSGIAVIANSAPNLWEA